MNISNYKPKILGPKKITPQEQHTLLKFNLKTALKLFFSNQFSFIYTITNFFLPFFLCLISSFINPNGVLVVIVVGLTSSFYTIFNQLAMVLSQILSRRVIKEYQNPLFPAHDSYSSYRGYLINSSLITSTIYGIVMSSLFMLSAGLYTHYISVYKNLFPAVDYAWILVMSLVPTIFLVYINDILLVEMFLIYGNKRAVIVLLMQFIAKLTFVTVLTLNLNIGVLGIGLGMMCSSLFDLFINCLLISYKANIFRIDKVLFKQNFSQDIKISWFYILRFLFGYVTKSILVLITGIVTSAANREIYSTLIVARIIWYNIIFVGSWFADGCVLQVAMYKLMYWHDRLFPLNFASLIKFQLITGAIIEFLTLLCFGLLVPEIAGLYTLNLPTNDIGNIIDRFNNVTKWSVNSMINLPLTNIGSQSPSYVQGGSYTMIFLGIYVWMNSLGKIGTLTPYSLAHPRKTDLYSAYVNPVLTVITIITCSILTRHNTTGFFINLQGFTFPLIFFSFIFFSIGMIDCSNLLKYLKSKTWLERFNQYLTTNPMLYRKWHFGESLRKNLSSL